MEKVQGIRAALAEGRHVLMEAQKDLIKQQTALLGEDGEAIMRVIQEDAVSAGRLPADISRVIEKCYQDLNRRVERLEKSNEVQRER
jgi:ABC-type enterochelin transport system ATPase subunit